jgi:hypothetical protein
MISAVVATELGYIPVGSSFCTCGRNGAMKPTIPSTITTHFAARWVDGFAFARYCTEAMKLMKNSRNAVHAEGTW